MFAHPLKMFLMSSTCLGCMIAPSICNAQAAQGTAQVIASTSTVRPAETVGEIVVTAQRRTQRVDDIPMSIVAATGQQLKDLGVSSVADLQKIVPGFRFAESNYGPPVYSIRGIGFNDGSLGAKPTVALSADDAPLPFTTMAQGGATIDLDRVEVLKGPQGTLYGQNATGGAVNYISAQPTKSFSAGGDVTYGRFSDVIVDGFISGPLTDNLQARLAVSTEESGTWQKSYTREDFLGTKDKKAARLLLNWEPTNNLEIKLNVNGSIDKSQTQAAQFIQSVPGPNLALAQQFTPLLLTYPPAPNDNRAADWQAGLGHGQNLRNFQAILRGDYKITDDITLTSVTSYSTLEQYREMDGAGVNLGNDYETVRGNIHVFSEELRATGALGKAFHWIVGGNYESDKTYELDTQVYPYSFAAHALDAFGGPFLDSGDLGQSKFETKAAFASATYELVPNLTASAGVRYTSTDIDFTGCSTNGADGVVGRVINNLGNYLGGLFGFPPGAVPGPGKCITLNPSFVEAPASSSLKQDNVSWKVGLDWKPLKGTLLYANIGKGFKAGSFPTITAITSNELAPVTQESVLAYEVGFKSRINDMLHVEGAVFYYDYSNKQVYGDIPVIAFGNLPALINIPKSHVTGAELSVTLKPVQGLTATGGVSYIDSRIDGNFTNFSPLGQAANFSGEAFPLTSKWNLSADVEYQAPISDLLNGFIGGSVSYVSRTNGGLGNEAILNIPGYALVDLRAGVETRDKAWRFSVWGKNITNQFYITQADANVNIAVRYAGMPAMYGMSIAYRFH